MRSLSALVIVAVALLAASLVRQCEGSTQPPTVLHQPPRDARRSLPVTVSATIEGQLGMTPTVLLYHRGQHERLWASVPMQNTSDSHYDAVIPAESCQAFAVRYYIEVIGTGGDYMFALGSAARPLSFNLVDPPPEEVEGAWDWNAVALNASFFALPFLLVAWVHVRDRNSERAVIERRFWIEVLLPFIKLRGQPLTDELTRLSGLAIRHPIDGKRTFSRRLLSRRMRDVRRVVTLIDQLFWIDTLRPIEHLRGDLLSQELQKLAQRVLTHPLEVSRRYTAGVLLHKLEDIRGLDRARLEREKVRLLGIGFSTVSIRRAA